MKIALCGNPQHVLFTGFDTFWIWYILHYSTLYTGSSILSFISLLKDTYACLLNANIMILRHISSDLIDTAIQGCIVSFLKTSPVYRIGRSTFSWCKLGFSYRNWTTVYCTLKLHIQVRVGTTLRNTQRYHAIPVPYGLWIWQTSTL